MHETEALRYYILGVMSELSEEDRDAILFLKECIEEQLDGHGEHGNFAVLLLTLDYLTKIEENKDD